MRSRTAQVVRSALVALPALVVAAAALTGCGGSGAGSADVDAAGAPPTVIAAIRGETTPTTVPGDGDGDGAAQGSAERDAWEIANQMERTATTVRLDNAAHEVDGTVPRDLVVEKLVATVAAAEDNWANCTIHLRACDFERDVASVYSGMRLEILQRIYWRHLEERLLYRPGPVDIRVVTAVDADVEPPLSGIVTVCEVDDGETYSPAFEGEPEVVVERVDAGVLLSYVVVQDQEGTFKVVERATELFEADDQGYCDEYLD